MSGGVAIARGTARKLALIADPIEGSRQFTTAALATFGATAFQLAAASDLTSALFGQHRPDVVIVDQDFGGIGQGLHLVARLLRLSDVTIVLLGSELDSPAIEALPQRCYVLHRPVHGGQLRITLRLAMAQNARRRLVG